MLNPRTNERELAYVVYVDEIKPIPGRDRVECARVGGWTCMVPKGAFKVGDPGVYFEIDSKVPTDKEPFGFCEKYKGHIKTQKFKTPEGQFWSQGLLMAASDFGWTIDRIDEVFITDNKMVRHIPGTESAFLTKQLGITYYEVEDNKRKAASPDKYKKMAARHPQLFQKPFIKWLYKKTWGKKVLFLFFGKKKDKRGWPDHIAAKTDVERIQNMIWILDDKNPYVATEKIDGSSCSIMAERGKFGKIKYYICSRNVVFEDENQPCYYDENIYFEAYKKYNLKEKITNILNDYNLPNVALQMEVYGDKVQRRDYSLKEERQIMVFHIVSNGNKFPMDKVVEICEKYDIPHVPIIDDNFIFPDTIEELQKYVEGEGSKIDGKPREGIVFYDKKTGQQYTKFVSPEFLIKFHS